MFTYCGNNPVNNVDFCGTFYESALMDGGKVFLSKSKGSGNPRKDPRKGSGKRQPTRDRERNVGHPNGEEHSRVPKGPRRMQIVDEKGDLFIFTNGDGEENGMVTSLSEPLIYVTTDESVGLLGHDASEDIAIIAGVATGAYVLYRLARGAISLIPGLWWTIPMNAAIP
jgi:hypothetical protein